jgi:diamine N-acetyltransferase
MPPESLHIRRATPRDAEVVASLSARTFKSAYAAQIDPAALDRFVTVTFSPARIREELRDPMAMCLLASDGAAIVGYANLRQASPPGGINAPNPVELTRIYLEEQAIGHGYGSALMQACLDAARESNYETIWLGVWERNERAIQFYRRWGFTVAGSQAFDFLGETQTDLVMTRQIG